MKTYCVYDLDDHFLGELLAISDESAAVLAQLLFEVPHRVLTHRLPQSRRIAV